jgi:3-oxoacyl-[acyl-carrier protein] reductase
MNEQGSLKGQVGVVTGAGRGIGRAIAMAYANAGMSVVCAARSLAQIEDTVASIKAAGGVAAACACDVTSSADIANLMAVADKTYGGIDVVVVNAGMAGTSTSIQDADMDEWRQVIDLNLIAAVEQCRAATPYLRKRGGGKILFMGSGMGRNAIENSSAYACSKAGLAMLNRVLARELRQDAIAVNEMIPGPVRTQLTGVPEEKEVPTEQGADILRVPGEWTKNPEDVVPLALFLASFPNNGPTGQSYSLTGRDLGRI